MHLLLLLACGGAPPVSPPPAPAAPPVESEGPGEPANVPGPKAAPPTLGLPVAVYGVAGGSAVPLGAVPATAPGQPARAVRGSETLRWPTEGVEAATSTGQALRFTGSARVECPATERGVSGVALEQAAPDGAVVVAPASWARSWRAGAPVPADQSLQEQVRDRQDIHDDATIQVAVDEDLDGDGVNDRLIFAHAPQVDPEKPGVTTALWGTGLEPLEGLDLNGAVRLEGWVPTPAGPILVLGSQWMGGTGAHALVVEASKLRPLGEWVCGS